MTDPCAASVATYATTACSPGGGRGDPFVPQEKKDGVTAAILAAMCDMPADEPILQTHSHTIALIPGSSDGTGCDLQPAGTHIHRQ